MDSYQKELVWRDRLAAAETASKRGEKSRAELLYKQALALASLLSEQNHVTSLIHLADFYASGQEFHLAEPLFRQAVDIYERTFGSRNFIGAMCLRSLSEVLEAQGKSVEAETVKVKAMEILGALS